MELEVSNVVVGWVAIIIITIIVSVVEHENDDE